MEGVEHPMYPEDIMGDGQDQHTLWMLNMWQHIMVPRSLRVDIKSRLQRQKIWSSHRARLVNVHLFPYDCHCRHGPPLPPCVDFNSNGMESQRLPNMKWTRLHWMSSLLIDDMEFAVHLLHCLYC